MSCGRIPLGPWLSTYLVLWFCCPVVPYERDPTKYLHTRLRNQRKGRLMTAETSSAMAIGGLLNSDLNLFFPLYESLLIIEASRSHTDTSHSVVLLWTSDQPVAETSTWQYDTHKWQTSMPSAGFEPAILASELSKTQALDRGPLGSANCKYLTNYLLNVVFF